MARKVLLIVALLGGLLLLVAVVRLGFRGGAPSLHGGQPEQGGRAREGTPPRKVERLVTTAVPAPPANPAKKAALSLSGEKAAKVIKDRAIKYREAIRGIRDELAWLFDREARYGLREGRLLALSFPGVVEEAATSLAGDSQVDGLERAYAIYLLSQLAGNGSSSAKDTLFRLTADPVSQVSNAALAGVAWGDPDGTHRDLYWSKCRQWNTVAFSTLGRWVDPATISFLREIVAAVPPGADYPQGECRWMAQDALTWMEMLASPNLDERLAAILRKEGDPPSSTTSWALEMAGRRGGDLLKGVLKERLDAGLRQAGRMFGALARPGEPPMELQQEFVSSAGFSRHAMDGLYDEVLLTYWKTGAPLDELQKARLRTFGYACDPLERLLELMPELR
jgi:hypothetical protein